MTLSTFVPLASSKMMSKPGYVLTSAWRSNRRVRFYQSWATHLLVTARTGGSRREREGVELFLIEANAPGVTRRDYPTVDGFRASEVYFENVAIPGEALDGPLGHRPDEAGDALQARGRGGRPAHVGRRRRRAGIGAHRGRERATPAAVPSGGVPVVQQSPP